MAEFLPIKKRPSYRLVKVRQATHLAQSFISRTSMADNSERCMNHGTFSFISRSKPNVTYCVGKKKTGLSVSLKRKRVSEGTEENVEPNKTSSSPKKALVVVKRRWVQGGNPSWEPGQTSRNNKPCSLLPSQLEKRIRAKGGRDVQLVIRKKLTGTDLNKQQGRLLIPWQQIREDACFLTEEEETFLNSNRREKGKNEIRVMVMEPCGVDSQMALVKWSMQSSDNYILRTGWNNAVERNHKEKKHLKADQFIQLWSFRVGPQLWFAIDAGIPSSNPDTCVELEDKSAEKD